MNIQNGVPPRVGAEAQEGKYLCLLLSSSYPEEFLPYRPQIPPPFTQIGPRQAPTSQPTRVTFSRISSLMNHRKHERRGLSIFCRWKRPGWHIFADNEKCLGFFTFGLPPAPLCLSGQLKYWTSYFGTRVKNAAAAIDSGGQLWKLKTFEKHDKFQMYHKTTILCIETYAAVNEIKFWDCYYIYCNFSSM